MVFIEKVVNISTIPTIAKDRANKPNISGLNNLINNRFPIKLRTIKKFVIPKDLMPSII
jgi:hypothetical protein